MWLEHGWGALVRFSMMLLVGGLIGCGDTDPVAELQNLQAKYSLQYQSWQSTETSTEQSDQLVERPAMVVLWAGSSFSTDYRAPRGHRFALTDVTKTLRTGIPNPDKAKSASCWSCKTPDAPRLMAEMGEENFAASDFFKQGSEMAVTVGCTDCHEPGSSELRLNRPHAEKAMAKIHMPFDSQDKRMQGAQTCGQCHVTYYFQPESSNIVNIPWIFGSTADEIEKYYDTRRFYEWLHPISRTPMLKARHPEFEHWSRSHHAKENVTCVTCHMPEITNGKGQSYSDHNVGGALENFDQACADCHNSKSKLVAALEHNKQAIEKARHEVEMLLVSAHYEAKAAWDAGASWNEMDEPLMDIRHAQWRWDFATASHGLHAHNPEEGLALLTKAKTQAEAAREKLATLLVLFQIEKVDYPDLSSKASAQKAVSIELESLDQAKQQFIEEQVKQHWPEATHRGL